MRWLKRTTCALLLLGTVSVWAQAPATTPPPLGDTPPVDDVRNHPWTVFTEADPTDPAATRLRFLDPVTGAERSTSVYAERLSLAADAVMYWAPRERRVKLARPNADNGITVTDHPFVQPEPQALRVDWAVSPDGKLTAWTQTFAVGASLSTVTRIAERDGSPAAPDFRDGPRDDGLRALPVAFDLQLAHLFMDYQPDGLADLTLFPQYAGLFALDLAAGETAFLPGEPGDYTGAGFGAGMLLRLALADDLRGFDLRVIDTASSTERRISGGGRGSLSADAFTQAGDLRIAPDGRYAVYALATITDFGSSTPRITTRITLVDLFTNTQRPLGEPITTLARPVAWTEESSAVILVSPQQPGTWKLTLADGRLARIADASFLGTLLPLD